MSEAAFNEALISVIHLLGAIAAAIIPVLLAKLLQRINVDTKLAQGRFLEAIALDMAMAVEEWAAARLKANPQTSVTAQQKAEHFLFLLMARVPWITPSEAMTLSQAAVAKLGIGAAHSFRALDTAVRGTESDRG